MGSSSKEWWTTAVHNRLVALVLAMVVLVPLIATPVDRGIHGLAALTFEGFGLLLLGMLLWRSSWSLRGERVVSFLRTAGNLPILLLLGLAVVSCVVSPHKAYSAQEALRLGAGVLLYFVVAYQFRRSEQLTKLVDTLLFVAIGASLLGFVQFGESSLMGVEVGCSQCGNHKEFAVGLFGDHQLFGSFLMLLLPLLAIVALTEKASNRQLAAQVATVMTGTCLLLAHSRSAWIGAAAGLTALSLLGLYVAARSRSTAGSPDTLSSRKHEWMPVVALLVVACGFFLAFSPQTVPILQRMTSLERWSQDSTWQVRQSAWQGAVTMVRERPLSGFGLGLYPYYQQSYTHTGVPIAQLGGRPSLGEQAHNLYLQTAVELGLPGLGMLVAALVCFWVAGVRRVVGMEAGIRRSLLLGTLAGSVAFAVDGFASPSWQFGEVSMFLWLMMGLGVSCLLPHAHRQEEDKAPSPALSPRLLRPASVLATLGLAALLPTVSLAGGGGGYNCPVSATIIPGGHEQVMIQAGQSQAFTLTVKFQDGTTQDVTLSSFTIFTKSGGAGFLTGPNNHIYQSVAHEDDALTITGTYSQTGCSPVRATARVEVHP